MNIPLKAIYSAASNRAAGYIEEVKKRGKIQGDNVELSETDFNYISENFKLGSKPKAENSKTIQGVKSEEVKIETKNQTLILPSGKANEISQVLFK